MAEVLLLEEPMYEISLGLKEFPFKKQLVFSSKTGKLQNFHVLAYFVPRTADEQLTVSVTQEIVDNTLVGCSLIDDLKKYLSDNVTLIGSDGRVEASKTILQARSSVLTAMFSHEMEESKTLTIDLKDFNSETLQAFVDFLWTDRMNQNKDTAIGLYIFGDKYDVKQLKCAAEKYIVANIKILDRDEVFEVMLKINPEKLKQVFKDNASM